MQYMRVYAPVDLDAIVFNLESMRKNIDRETGMLGVIKADAYGHGSVPVAAAIEDYVDGFAVATADEAMLLRRNGIQKMILILGVTHPSRYQELIENEIRPAIFTMAQAKPLSEAAVNMKKTAKIHLALDTGMRRIGLEADESGADLAAAIGALPGIEVEGLFTHFSRADEMEKTSAMTQLGRYLHFTGAAESTRSRNPDQTLFQQRRHHRSAAGEFKLRTRRHYHVWHVSIRRSTERQGAVKAGAGFKIFRDLCKGTRTGRGDQLWRYLCDGAYHAYSYRGSGIWGWISAKLVQLWLCADLR